MHQTYFDELFERWQVADEVDDETLQLIKDTFRFTQETSDERLRGHARQLLSDVYHLPSTPQEIVLIGEALEGTGIVSPEIPPEDDEAR